MRYMKYVKTYESFSTINEEFSIKSQLKKGMEKMKELLENNPEIKKNLEENFSKLSDEQKEDLKRPGILKRIKDLFNTDDAEALFGRSTAMVSESAESLMDKAFAFIGKFFNLKISGLIALFGGAAAALFGTIAELGLLGLIGAGAMCIGWLITMSLAGMDD